MQQAKTIEELKNLKKETLIVDNVSAIKTETIRKDGKPSRQYLTVIVKDADNLMDEGAVGTKNIFQTHTAVTNPTTGEVTWEAKWKFNPSNIIPGAETKGAIVSMGTKPYFIENENGKDMQDGKTGTIVHSYKVVALPSEMDSLKKMINLLGEREFIESETTVVNTDRQEVIQSQKESIEA